MSGRGFTLVEVLFALAILAVIAFGLATGVGAGHASARTLEAESKLFARGQELLERMLAVRFGSRDDPVATAGELNEFFDPDDEFGALTLHKLAKFGPAVFEPADFGVRGKFRVIVTDDLNLDGDIDDADEGRADLLLILVLHEGRQLARSVRFDPNG